MIFNLRLQKILDILLCVDKVVTGEYLCNTLGVSSRTIRSDIKELNYILKDKGSTIISEKFETIKHLANLIDERLVDVDKYVEDVKARESLSTTGIGDGVAIPHAKSSWVKEPTE